MAKDQRSPLTRLQAISIGLAGLGWLASGCLLLRMSAVGAADVGLRLPASTLDLCRGCDDALMSTAAFAAGVPLPAIGLVYFAAVACLLVIGNPWAARMALLLSAAGTGAGIVLCTGVGSSALAACPLCVAVPALNLAMVVAVLASLPGEGWPGGWAAVAFAVVPLSAAVSFTAAHPGDAATQWLEEYRAAPAFAIPGEPSDRLLGPATAAVRLVVFTSLPCPWCGAFADTIVHLRARFGDHLTVVFKHFPLESDCNPGLASKLQPGACAAAWAAEAAALQGRFWRYQEFLLARGAAGSESAMSSVAAAAGLDVTRWEQDRASAAVRARVERDVRLGLRLGVDGTPAVFLDGRRVRNLDLIVLASLIRGQLSDVRKRTRGL